MICPKCSKDTTKTKEITSKKDGKKYTMFVCTNGCMDGKWPLSFFPPKQGSKMFELLEQINRKLDLLIGANPNIQIDDSIF